MKATPTSVLGGGFARIISIATAMGFAGMLGSLACMSRGTRGRFVIGWSAWSLVLGAVGFALGLWFWRLLWRAEAEKDTAHPARRALIRYSVFLGVLAFCCFVYPIRFVDPVRRSEVIIGLGMAIAVLTFVGWFIFQTIRWVSANELKDGESE